MTVLIYTMDKMEIRYILEILLVIGSKEMLSVNQNIEINKAFSICKVFEKSRIMNLLL